MAILAAYAGVGLMVVIALSALARHRARATEAVPARNAGAVAGVA